MSRLRSALLLSLAAVDSVGSDFGRHMWPSSAGALGWMQFMPATWAMWGVDANGDGAADPWQPEDAVHAAALQSGAGTTGAAVPPQTVTLQQGTPLMLLDTASGARYELRLLGTP